MGYLDAYLEGNNLKKIVNHSIELIKRRVPDFDTIAVRGQSGTLVGSPLAMLMEKDLIIVRKNDERTHSSSRIEGWGSNQKILLVDDFIESGTTIDQMYETITEVCSLPTVVGIFLYSSTERRMRKYTHADGTTFPVTQMYRFQSVSM